MKPAFLLYCCPSLLYAQKENNIRAFDGSIDFNTGVPLPITTAIHSSEGCATVSDRRLNSGLGDIAAGQKNIRQDSVSPTKPYSAQPEATRLFYGTMAVRSRNIPSIARHLLDICSQRRLPDTTRFLPGNTYHRLPDRLSRQLFPSIARQGVHLNQQ